MKGNILDLLIGETAIVTTDMGTKAELIISDVSIYRNNKYLLSFSNGKFKIFNTLEEIQIKINKRV